MAHILVVLPGSEEGTQASWVGAQELLSWGPLFFVAHNIGFRAILPPYNGESNGKENGKEHGK